MGRFGGSGSCLLCFTGMCKRKREIMLRTKKLETNQIRQIHKTWEIANWFFHDRLGQLQYVISAELLRTSSCD